MRRRLVEDCHSAAVSDRCVCCDDAIPIGYAGVDTVCHYNIVPDMFSIFLSTTINRDNTITTRYLILWKKLFATIVEQTGEEVYPLYLVLVQLEQKIYLRNRNSKIIVYMQDSITGYSQQ